MGAKVKELEDKLNSTQSADGSEETAEGEGGDQAQAQPETTKELNQYKDRISDLFGDEAAEAVMSPIRDLVQQTKQILEGQRQAIVSIQSDQQVRTLTEARSQLQERFPRLANDTDFGKVVEGMRKLAAIGEYDNVTELMTDSYRVNFAKTGGAGSKEGTSRPHERWRSADHAVPIKCSCQEQGGRGTRRRGSRRSALWQGV